MSKILHVIPGLKDTCDDEPYQQLMNLAINKSYKVIPHNVDWEKPLSAQVFSVSKDSVVFGFSLGAILAWLVAQKYPCQHVILASMTPHYSFVLPEIKKALVDRVGSEFVEDVISNLVSINQANRQTLMYGSLEKEPGDVIVSDTEHDLNNNYIKEVIKLI